MEIPKSFRGIHSFCPTAAYSSVREGHDGHGVAGGGSGRDLWLGRGAFLPAEAQGDLVGPEAQ